MQHQQIFFVLHGPWFGLQLCFVNCSTFPSLGERTHNYFIYVPDPFACDEESYSLSFFLHYYYYNYYSALSSSDWSLWYLDDDFSINDSIVGYNLITDNFFSSKDDDEDYIEKSSYDDILFFDIDVCGVSSITSSSSSSMRRSSNVSNTAVVRSLRRSTRTWRKPVIFANEHEKYCKYYFSL